MWGSTGRKDVDLRHLMANVCHIRSLELASMTESEGWSPLSSQRGSKGPSPRRRSKGDDQHISGIGNGLVTTSFTKLARVHALSIIGDGCIAVALAGSIFFSIDASEARWRVALYLLLTIAPFAVVTPLLGPAIDRAAGGRRGMIIVSLAGRVVIALLMSRHIDSLLLFPEAFAMLVLQKAYGVSRAALVPAVCPREDELIEANSKLSLLSSIGGVVGGSLGVGLIAIFGNGASTFLAAIIFAIGVSAALKLPQVQVAKAPVDETEKLEVRGANIVLAATAIAVLRGIVGFTTFLLAFHLRAGGDGVDVTEEGSLFGAALGAFREGGYNPDMMPDLIGTPGPPQWHLAAAGLAAGGGAFLGAKFAPDIRHRTTEERIVLGAMITTTIAAFLGAWGGGIQGTVVLAFGVGISASVGKLGFDALVQRDAPRSNHGRAFAQFEGRFQLSWAIGAFFAVISRFPIGLGAFMIAIAAGFAALSYELGRRTDRVQASSRMREVIRDRVPQKAVDKIESAKAVQTVRPVIERVAGVGRSLFSVNPSAVAGANAGQGGEEKKHLSQGQAPSNNDLAGNDGQASETAEGQRAEKRSSTNQSGRRSTDRTEIMGNDDPTIAARVPPPPTPPAATRGDDTGNTTIDAGASASAPPETPVVQTSKTDDPTPVGAMPIDQLTWGQQTKPQVSGDGVWVAAEETPEGEAGEDGQFRLWE